MFSEAPQAMVTGAGTMIGGKDDDCILSTSHSVQFSKNPADTVVHTAYRGRVAPKSDRIPYRVLKRILPWMNLIARETRKFLVRVVLCVPVPVPF